MLGFLSKRNKKVAGEWLKVSELKVGMQIAVPKDGVLNSHKAGQIDSRESIENGDVLWDEIESIEYVGREQVWDIEVEGTHNFVGNNIFAHNTYLNGNLGVGINPATARLHLAAGTATASTAPLKFTSGTNLTTPEAGAMEWNGTNLFITQTTGPTRQTLAYTSDLTSGYIPYTGGTSNVDLGVHNLTVDTNSLFVDSATHRVGIGTTSPTELLSLGNGAARKFWIENTATDVVGRALTVAAGSTVAGSSLVDVAGGNLILQAGLGTGTGTSTISFQTGIATTGATVQTMSTKMTILGSGNVGIGTISPTANLQVAQDTAGVGIVSNGAGGTTVTGSGTQFLNTFKVGDTITINGQTVAISAIASDTSMTTAAITAANTEVAYTLVGGNRFSVLGNGNVGIGNTSPRELLHVGAGTDIPMGDGYTSLYVTNNGNTGITVRDSANDVEMEITAWGGAGWVGTKTNHPLYFETNDSYALMTLDTSGNVGIGTTGPAQKLDVNGNIQVQSGGSLLSAGTTLNILGATDLNLGSGNGVKWIISNGLSGDFVPAADNTYNLGGSGNRIKNLWVGTNALIAGNVGIGTTSPTLKLSVNGVSGNPGTSGTSQNGAMRITTDGGNQALDIGLNNSTGLGWIQSTRVSDLSSNWSLALNPNGGNVGIGTTAPGTILEIGSSDLGNGAAGPIITLGRNTNGTNTGAGSINFLGKAGTAGYVWQDAAGNMRINTAAPTNANDVAGTVIGAQTSTRDTKQDINDYTDYSNALSMIVNAPLHTFRYKNEVNGYGSDSPLAKVRLGYIADEVDPMFMWGNSIDQVSVNGLLMASIKELNLKITDLSKGQIASPGDSLASSLGEYASAFFSGVISKVEGTVAYMKDLVVDTLKIGSPEKPTGITLYDETNGKPYCFSISDGTTKTKLGECGSTTPVEKDPELTYSPKDTNAPIITLNGDTLISLNVGDAYTDPGAIATDDIDGEVAMIISGSVDTAVAGTYTITYSARDSSGNTTEATREVKVGGETTTPTSEPTPEIIPDPMPTPESEPQPEASQPSTETPASTSAPDLVL